MRRARHELVIRMVVHRHAQQQVGDAGEILLVGGAFVFGYLDGLVVKGRDLLADPHAEHLAAVVEEVVAEARVDVRAAEADPVLVPPRFAVGHVAVPAVGAQQHHVPGADADALAVGPVERAAARGDIEQLVALQNTPFSNVKIETRGVSDPRRIGLVAGGDGLAAHSIDRDAPRLVLFAAHQVLMIVHRFHTAGC